MTLAGDAMAEIEYAVDIWDLSGTDGRPNAEQLLEHLREFADEGWELVSLSFSIDLARHGPSHLLVFKRAGEVQRQLLELMGRLRRRLVEILDTCGWPGKSLVGD
jgi:hypothetical protein